MMKFASLSNCVYVKEREVEGYVSVVYDRSNKKVTVVPEDRARGAVPDENVTFLGSGYWTLVAEFHQGAECTVVKEKYVQDMLEAFNNRTIERRDNVLRLVVAGEKTFPKRESGNSSLF